MTERIYNYKDIKGNELTETFSDYGYVTLLRNGDFVYEHQFSVSGVMVQEFELITLLKKHNVDFELKTIEIKL
tara:strand:+ start:2484 stop:2702 length:219 start_codon:yes stop_codon:yes gene_type:complete